MSDLTFLVLGIVSTAIGLVAWWLLFDVDTDPTENTDAEDHRTDG